jgi:DHA1 family chloramphenicol resistance protein-like MFS transporter
LCLGLVLTLLGANQADLARDLELDLARTGMLASALALGFLVGTLGAGPLYDRLPRRPIFVAAILVTAAGLFGFGSDLTFRGALFRFAWVGLGAGAYDTMFIAAVADRYRDRSAMPMSLLLTGTAIGAIVGPLLIAAIATRWYWTHSFHAIGIFHLVLAAACLRTRFPEHTRSVRPETADPPAALSMAIAPFIVVVFAYLGLESTLSAFAIPYASDALSLDVIRGQTAISVLWFGLLTGRLGMLLLKGNLDGRVLIGSGLLSCAAIAIGAAAGASQIEILYFCVGFLLAPVFPVTIALAGQRFPNSLGSMVSVTVGLGSTSTFVVPWLTGVLGDHAGIAFAMKWLSVWALVIALGGAIILRGRVREMANRVS